MSDNFRNLPELRESSGQKKKGKKCRVPSILSIKPREMCSS